MWGWFPRCLGQRLHGQDAPYRECLACFSFTVRLLSAEHSEIYVAGCCDCVCVHVCTYELVFPWKSEDKPLEVVPQAPSPCFLFFVFFADRICHWPGHFSHLLGWLAASQAPQASWSLPPQGCSIKERSCYKFVKLFCAALHWFPFLLSILWSHTCFSVSQCLFALVKSVRDHPRKGSRSGPLSFCNALIAFVLLRANLDESQILNSPQSLLWTLKLLPVIF